MPITSSGEIALIADIEAEFDQTGTEDISLVQAATDAGLSATDASMFGFYGASDVAVGAVTTNSISSVSGSGMTLNGNITNDGGGTITDHGFYFGTDGLDYTQNTKVSLGTGSVGSYSSVRTGLSSQTTYYATAYVVNSAGESVGATVSAATVFTYQTTNLTRLRTAMYQVCSYYTTQNIQKMYVNVSTNQYLHSSLPGQNTNSNGSGHGVTYTFNYNTQIYSNTAMRIYSRFGHNSSYPNACAGCTYTMWIYKSNTYTTNNFTSHSTAPSPYTNGYGQASLSMPGAGATYQLVGYASRTVAGTADIYMGINFTY